MKTVKNAWVFDVDGVITDIEQEKVTEPPILDNIIRILEKGEPVAFNTGRGIDWTQEAVLNQLKNKTINPQVLQNLLIVAEDGGVKATFNQDRSLNIKIDESLRMPYDLDQNVRELVKEKYSQSMLYEDKKTMITTKIREGTPIEEYRKNQLKIVGDLQKLIDTYGASDEMKVDVSTIGTNIMYKTTGKDRGTELILEWVLEKGIKPEKFITFGDSESDMPMAEKLYKNGYPVEFMYVGEENIDISKYPFPIKILQNKYGKGTLEFLKSL